MIFESIKLIRQLGMLSDIVRLSLPIALQAMIAPLLGIIDISMVSSLGASAVAAVGVGSKFYFAVFVSLSGIGIGCSILVAQCWGANNKDGIRIATILSLVSGVMLVLPLSIYLAIDSAGLMRLATSDHNIINLGSKYLSIVAISFVLMHIIMIYEYVLRATGHATQPLLFSVLTIICNFILNYAFIFGHFGAPEMGVAGAAVATLLARVIQLLLITVYLFWHQRWLLPSSEISVNKSEIKRFFNLSWPLIVNFSLWAVGNFCYHVVAGHVSSDALAALSIVTPIEGILHSVFIGLTTAGGIMLGHRLGRNDRHGAWQLAQFFIFSVIILSAALGIALYILRNIIFHFFGEVDPEVLNMANIVFTIMCLTLVLRMLPFMIVDGVLRSGGDNRYCLIVDMSCMWGIGIPLTFLAAFYWQWSYPFVYAMFVTEEAVKIVFLFHRTFSKRWMNNLVSDNKALSA